MCPFPAIGVSISRSLILLASIFFCQNVWHKNLKEERFVLNLSFWETKPVMAERGWQRRLHYVIHKTEDRFTGGSWARYDLHGHSSVFYFFRHALHQTSQCLLIRPSYHETSGLKPLINNTLESTQRWKCHYRYSNNVCHEFSKHFLI